jgi:hypothetical protein
VGAAEAEEGGREGGREGAGSYTRNVIRPTCMEGAFTFTVLLHGGSQRRALCLGLLLPWDGSCSGMPVGTNGE